MSEFFKSDKLKKYNVVRNNGIHGSEADLVHSFKTRFEAECYAESKNKNISNDEPVFFYVEVAF